MNIENRVGEVVMVRTAELEPHPKNPNKHPKEQIDRLIKILEYQGWRYPIKVSTRSGFVTSGHGRLLAAKKMGLKEVPVSYQDYDSEEQEYADIVSDNSIAGWAELDLSSINLELSNLGPDLDIDLLGIDGFDIDAPGGALSEEEVEAYTKKIESPIYKPTGERPKIEELYSKDKTHRLYQEIQKLDCAQEIKEFLFDAATRHTVFNYDKIAEFYAHASPEVQAAMERSALVIIDFKKAIEEGFVVLSKEIAEIYPLEEDPA